MTKKDFFTILKQRWEAIIIITTIATTFGLYINFFLPHYYRASSEFLIVQKQNPNIDAYTAIKGSEQLAYTFKQVVLSPAVFDRIFKLNFDIENNYFGTDQEKMIKKWQKTIAIETLPNTGILKIGVFHPEQKQAQQISEALAYIINNERGQFLGDNPEISIVSLSKSIISNKTVKPNALANTFLGFVAGICGSLGLIMFFPEKKLSFRVKKTPVKIEKDISSISRPKTIKYSLENQPFSKKTSAPSNLPIA